jgi:DNA-binding MarR family transcriptional regulator
MKLPTCFLGGAMTRLDLLRFVPFRLNRLAAEVSRGLAHVYADQFGIDIAEWRVLATLGMGEPRSAQFIVRCTRTHKSKISRAVSRLALAGLIEGVPNDEDRRETQLRMTQKGRALYEKLVPVVLEYERGLLSSLSEEELAGLVLGLARLEQALGLIQNPGECLQDESTSA